VPETQSQEKGRLEVRAASLALTFAFAAAMFAACAPTPTGAAGVKVVATTTIIADLARQVAGPDASVDSLAPSGAAVEDYQPAPEDARRVAEANVILINGLALDRWSEKLRGNARPDAKVAILSDGLPRLGIGESTDEDINKNGNPHYWFDVRYAKTYVERIRDALVAADPAHEDGYISRTTAYLAKLDDLDKEIRAQVQQLLPERRKLVTSHDAFPYFARAYGFKIVGFAEPEAGKEPSAAELAELVEKVKAEKVPAIFSEAQVSAAIAQALAKDAGVKTVVTDLITDSLGPPPADSYLGLMRADVKKIVDALK
jgi:ABC-type Zn uptake system ZnuABC Zn-binding protein ZnuA